MPPSPAKSHSRPAELVAKVVSVRAVGPLPGPANTQNGQKRFQRRTPHVFPKNWEYRLYPFRALRVRPRYLQAGRPMAPERALEMSGVMGR